MDAPVVLEGDYADLKFIKTRSVCQMVIEVPIERGADLVRMFGTPVPGSQVPVAVARLVPLPERTEEPAEAKEKRRLSELEPVTQAALTCQRKAFWKYLREVQDAECEGEDDAATFVRRHCGINTRAALTPKNAEALQKWWELSGSFNDWMHGAVV